MSRRTKYPGLARTRSTGADTELQKYGNFQYELYATNGDLQSRYLQRRCGLSRRQAHLVASLHFGEGGR